MEKKSKFGPGFLVAAAFIGPGTVVTATRAGASCGYSLIWVVVIAIFAAIVLQEMVGRFSLSTKIDVAAALVQLTKHKWLKLGFQILAFLAIIVGCAAYEAGNIIGGSMGLNILTNSPTYLWVILISLAAVLLLWRQSYKIIEKFLIGLVVLMGISFFISAIIVKPDFSGIINGFIPGIPKNSMLLILALLGTTVVPYNLFLHSSTILKKWKGKTEIPWMRTDTYLSIGLGGVITISIIITATAAYFFQDIKIKNAADLSLQLAPLLGRLAKIFFGIGLFSAGLSSAITAPYAAAWTASGLFGWKENSSRFRAVFLIVILFGVMVSISTLIFGLNPLHMIVFAQVANALLLPIVSLFILYLLNKKEVGEFKNTVLQNIIFVIVFIIIIIINLKKFI
ncbi:MAG: Nramp family divalent metal transporter [Candidatus Aminicenantes bacterium]|nr:MAG: Nramp family divalent metal transporter [Candidatus Aminicenantes bacterium]